MRLFHFSEDPGIACFAPRPVRVPAARPPGQEWLNGPLVWAIAEPHARLYLFPRDCPRIVVWATAQSSAADRARWLGDLAPGVQAVAYVERDWLARIGAATVYRYELPAAPFRSLDDAGMHVSTQAVQPLAVHAVYDLRQALEASGTALRPVGTLSPLRPLWQSTLHASGIRLRHAAGWSD
ncbi:DUF6886 family protein [Pseudorhodoferax sp.]|uniref:DUF6886 family protein n=1 Tax=Pseudorhodoferax sp. TaxID=1993553 RepID=UPI002DD666F2|nr:DUF6886 family protein [Pseudorhodoferax sp.]